MDSLSSSITWAPANSTLAASEISPSTPGAFYFILFFIFAFLLFFFVFFLFLFVLLNRF